MIVSFLISINSLFLNHLEEQTIEKEYLETINNYKRNVLEKVNGEFIDAEDKRSNIHT
jgi:hypothetical protein